MIDAADPGGVLSEECQKQAFGGGQDTVGELIAVFKRDVAARLRALRKAVMAGDIAAAGAQAQSIKGIAIQIGAVNLITTCRHLELDAAHHVTENLKRLLLEAEAEFRVLQATMIAD